MTGLEQLNEETRDMSLENLTKEEAMEGVKFSPELIKWKTERNEYFKNLVEKVDVDAFKNFLKETEINVLDFKNTLKNDYWFAETEINEAEMYLDKGKVNPNMIESDLEWWPLNPLIWPLVVVFILQQTAPHIGTLPPTLNPNLWDRKEESEKNAGEKEDNKKDNKDGNKDDKE